MQPVIRFISCPACLCQGVWADIPVDIKEPVLPDFQRKISGNVIWGRDDVYVRCAWREMPRKCVELSVISETVSRSKTWTYSKLWNYLYWLIDWLIENFALFPHRVTDQFSTPCRHRFMEHLSSLYSWKSFLNAECCRLSKDTHLNCST